MKTTLLLAALSGLVQCRETVVESIAALPLGWKKVRDADPSTQLKLRIALEQPNTAVFEQKLYDVSNPEHPLYGRHLEREELAQLLAPRDESTSAVLNWLREAGVPGSKVENDGDWINFQVSVSKAEEMLGAKFGVYRYLDSGVDQVRALAYSVPEEVKEHITFIAPIIRFGQPKAQRSQVFEVLDAQNAALTAAKVPPQTLNVTACNATITPECLRALYRVGSYQADPSKRSLFGVAGYLEASLLWITLDTCQRFPNTILRSMPNTTNSSSSSLSTPLTPLVPTSLSSRSTAAATTKLTQSMTTLKPISTSNTPSPCPTRPP
jgi:tripeptidyl-peptidase-1